MKAKKCTCGWNIFLLILSALFVFWGCSSSGGSSSGGGGGGGGSTGLTYTGETSEATVDGDNAQALTEDALAGGSTSFGSGGVAGAATTGGQKVQKPMKLALMMKNLAGRIKISPKIGGGAVGATESMSDTVYGSDGGSADFSITVDTVSGAFSGSITFYSFSEVGVTYDGTAGFTGYAVFIGEEFQGIDSFTFDYDNVTCASFGTSFTIDGTMAFEGFYEEWPYPWVTMNMVYRDDGSGKTYQMENFIIYFDFEYLDDEFDPGYYYYIEGTFYHPDYGYVSITTTEWFWQYVYDAYPSYEGELYVYGGTGSEGGSTYARLVIGHINYNTYEIYADTDGDGFDPETGDADDYYSGELSWVIF